MSCNTKTSLAAVIDAVNAQLNNNYVDRDDPRINQGVFTEPTIRGGLMLDEAAKLDFCGYVTECGQREPFGKQWVDRPLYPHNTLVSYEDGGEIKSRWQDTDDVVAGTEIGESYTAYEETRSLGLQGYTTIDSFELGATITQRDQALRHAATGKLYRWAGDLPKIVPTGSTPDSSGGVDTNAWLEVSDTALRQEILTGGLITDTLVTATANGADRVARTQHDINAERTSIKDFGNYGDGGDWTPALRKIVGKDLKVWLPRGTYIFKTDAIDCLGQDIHFEGDDATVILEKGTGSHVFNITDCESVIFRGITFQAVSTGVMKLLGWNPDSLIGFIDVQHCKFSGRLSLFRENGTKTKNAILEPFGIKKFIFDNNEFDNAEVTFIQLVDIPIYRGYVRDNDVTNLHYPIFYLAIGDSSANGTALSLTGKVSLKRNTVVTDDSHWLPTGATYQCFALVECREVEWVDNNISGMKSREANVSLYDAYLSSKIVHSKGNTYKNNAVFNPSNTKTTLIKAKSDSIPELTVSKIFEDNTYTVEREWVERIGETTCTHKLFGIGVSNAGNVILKNLTIDIIGVSGDDPYFPMNINMQNINIIAEDRIGGGSASILRPIPFDSNATLKMKNIDVVIKNATSTVDLYNQTRPTMEIWRSLEITDVDLSVGGDLYDVRLFLYLYASYARIRRNSINGVLAPTNLILSKFKDLDYKDNTYHSIKDVEIQPFNQGEFFGEVDFTETLSGVFNNILMFLALNHYDKNIRFKCDLKFEDATGITEASFEYTIKVDGSVVTLEVLDDLDELQTIVLGGASDFHRGVIKTVGTSSSESSVRVLFYGDNRPYLLVQPSPAGNRGKLTMRVRSFYI